MGFQYKNNLKIKKFTALLLLNIKYRDCNPMKTEPKNRLATAGFDIKNPLFCYEKPIFGFQNVVVGELHSESSV